jgi:hypothetical protein
MCDVRGSFHFRAVEIDRCLNVCGAPCGFHITLSAVDGKHHRVHVVFSEIIPLGLFVGLQWLLGYKSVYVRSYHLLMHDAMLGFLAMDHQA